MTSIEVLALLVILAMIFIAVKNEATRSRIINLNKKSSDKSVKILTKLKCDLCTHVHYVSSHPELIDEEAVVTCPWCERETTFEIVGKKEVSDDKDNSRIS